MLNFWAWLKITARGYNRNLYVALHSQMYMIALCAAVKRPYSIFKC